MRSNTSVNGDADDEKLLTDLGYKQELKRVMGFISSFCLQFTIVAVCAGLALTFNTGFAAVGPRVLPAWVLGGSLQVIVALGVAVGVSAFPLAGGPYQIIGRLGFPRLGWVMGLALVLGLIGNAAGEAVGLAPDYANYFGVTLNSHWSVLLGAAILIFVCMLLCLAGVRIAAFVNNGAVFAEGVAVLILVVGLAISWASGHGHFHNVGFIFSTAGIVKPGASTFLPFLSALLVPIFVVSQFFANGSAGEETRHASRTVPRALWTSAVVSLVVGIVVLFLAVLAVRNVSGTAASTEPLTYILRPDVGDFLARTFGVLAELALTVNLALCLLVAARLLWAYGRNDEMPASTGSARSTGKACPSTPPWPSASSRCCSASGRRSSMCSSPSPPCSVRSRWPCSSPSSGGPDPVEHCPAGPSISAGSGPPRSCWSALSGASRSAAS